MRNIDPEIELRHLRYFIAVAEELHFGRAAERLHIAQPPLSQQIRKLEAILGVPLLQRTSRVVKLTSAGELFLERARRTVRRVQEDLEEARSVGRGGVGFLKVGFIGSGMLTVLPSVLGRYRRQYPNVNLLLNELYSAGVMRALEEGTIDVGFLRDGGPAAGLDVSTVFSEPFVCVLPRRHPLARRRVLSAANLRDEPFVLFPSIVGRAAYEKTVSLCTQHGFRPNVVQEAPQLLTIARLVEAGLGVTILPACVERIAPPGVVCRRLSGARVKSDIELACRSGDDRAIVRAFCNMAQESFAWAGPGRERSADGP
jgi:DNA-binding transcriptional LysR family regulator